MLDIVKSVAHQDKPTKVPESFILEAYSPISHDLKQLEKALPTFLGTHSEDTNAMIRHLFDEGGGKRVRPGLFLLVCKMLDYHGEHVLPIAAVSEYVHTASLLHDDVVDSSSLRRNKPTTNSIWGDESAVLVGDLIYSTASAMMASTGKLEIVTVFASAIQKMSEGELLQLQYLFRWDIPKDVYFKIISGKTGVLIGASCRAAGILADASLEVRKVLEEFGHYIGLAFQMTDDALDYVGTREVFGKNILSDLRAGQVTLPLILMRDKLDKEEHALMSALFEKPEITEDEVKIVMSLLEKYGTVQETMELAKTYTQKSLDLLDDNFPESAYRSHMKLLIKKLLLREI